jgi:hypothetical protein
VSGAARPFFILVAHNPLGPWGTWQHRSSPLGEARPEPRDNARVHLDREARSKAGEHVTTSKLSSRGGRVRSHETRGSVGVHIGREVRSEAGEYVTASEPTSVDRCGPKV